MPLYLELGNTMAKLAERTGQAWKQERFEDGNHIVRRLRNASETVIALAAPARQGWLDAVRKVCTVREITPDPLLDFIGNSYDTPQTLGLDRVLNLLGLGADGVVISCGTAITVDALINGMPRFGAIMSGFRTTAEGLHNRIPALPLIEPYTPRPQLMPTRKDAQEGPLGADRSLPARTSEQSVRNGVVMGTTWGAAAIAGELWTACNGTGPAPITLTGGDAVIMQRYWPLASAPPNDSALLFQGMERVAPWL